MADYSTMSRILQLLWIIHAGMAGDPRDYNLRKCNPVNSTGFLDLVVTLSAEASRHHHHHHPPFEEGAELTTRRTNVHLRMRNAVIHKMESYFSNT